MSLEVVPDDEGKEFRSKTPEELAAEYLRQEQAAHERHDETREYYAHEGYERTKKRIDNSEDDVDHREAA